MPIGYILLIATTILVVFGVGQRVLDRMRLTDRQALVVIALIFVGGLIPNIELGAVSFSLGGAVVPLALCVYLFFKAGTGGEKARAIFSALLSGAAVFAAGKLLPAEPESMFIDPHYLYGLLAGLVACVLGRSRRSAFIGGVLGMLLADTAQFLISYYSGHNVTLNLGGAGALDAVIIAGLVAVLVSEGVGEIRERMQGGSQKRGKYEFEEGEFVPIKGGGPRDDEQS